jgi:hypothetical protein
MAFTPFVNPVAAIPWEASDNTLLLANGDPWDAVNTSLLAAGTVYLSKIIVRTVTLVSNVWFLCNTAGAGASSGSFVGIYSSAGVLLSSSADIGGLLTTAQAVEGALATPQLFQAGTFFWNAIVVNLATTQPSMGRGAGTNISSLLGLTAATARFAINGTGQSSLPASITPASNGSTGGVTLWSGNS